MEKVRDHFNEANQDVEAAFQPLFDLLMDSKQAILKRNDETYKAAKTKTMDMLEYLRNIYSFL